MNVMTNVKRLFLLVTLLGLLVGTAGSAVATTTYLYVKAGSTGSCTGSWANACGDLQTALNAANPAAGDTVEIWVAAGTYKPSVKWPIDFFNSDPRTATFTMKDGVAIYGGFAGTETDLSRRNPNPATNGTVLSGDIDATAGLSGGDAYHVVNTEVLNWGQFSYAATGITSSAVLDGFTITGGNATGASDPNNLGGGMWLHQGSPTLRNLRFVGNSATQDGGGMYVEPCYTTSPDGQCLQTTPTLTDVVFQGNTVTTAGGVGGGGMAISNYMSYSNPLLLAPSLTAVTFDGNTSANNGGGLMNNGAPIILTNVTFKNNIASGTGGGGLFSRLDANGLTLTLTNVDFNNNSAPNGGGLYSANSGISSALSGTNVRLLGNHATSEGGGVEAAFGNATLVNALFSGNSATNQGGGIAGRENSNTTLINATFSGNSAPKSAAIFVGDYPSAVVNLQNSIVYGNSGGSQIPASRYFACSANDTTNCGTANISQSLIQYGCPTRASCTSVVSVDPLFVNPNGADGTLGTVDDDPSLSTGSPAINLGDDSLVPPGVTTDLVGAMRKVGTVDLGAFEYQGNSTPAIALQPTNRTVNLGNQTTFTALAGGNPTPSVQWQASTDNGANWADISGATSTTYSFTPAATDTGNRYHAVFSNSVGSATSSAATLTVNFAPAMTAQPTNQSATVGGSATFTAAASGNPTPTVKWQVLTTASGATWTDLSGASTGTLTVSGVTASMNGYQYHAVFTNSAGSATSNPATLSVAQAPVITSANGTTFTVGTNGSFAVTATGYPTPSLSESGALPSGVSFNITSGVLSGTPAAGTGGTYAATFMATNGISPDATQSFTLTVNEAPTVTTQPGSQTVIAGGTASFTVAASGNPTPSVQWQVLPVGGSWTNISGATSTTLTLNGVTAGMSGYQYRAVFTNSVGSTTSNAATLTVNVPASAPTVTIQPTNRSAAVGGTATFTAAASGNPTPTVKWQVSTNGGKKWGDISGATGSTLTLSNVTLRMDGDQYRAVFSNSLGSDTTSVATLTVTAGGGGSSVDVGITQTGNYDSGTGSITWTLTVANLDANNAAQGVRVADTLVAGTRLSSVNTGGTGTYVTAGPNVVVSLGELAAGSSQTIIIKVAVTKASGTVNNSAMVITASNDPNALNNTSTASVTVP